MWPWLRSTLGLLLVAGLVACSGPAPSPTGPSVTPSPIPSPTLEITPEPTPTPSPTPVPTLVPDPAVMGLDATSCPGGVVLDWTPSTHRNFHHYTALRSPREKIAPDYPPIAPAVDWGRTYATDRFVTSAVDASVLPSATTWHYRVMAYDILNDVVSASPVRSAVIGDVLDLGPVEAATVGAATSLSWPAFGIGVPPHTILSDQSATSIKTDALHAGTTYQIQVEAVRVTTLGSFVSARSEILAYTVPSG